MPPRTLPLKESPSINDMEEYVYRDAINASIRFLYRPHTISVLSILLSGFVYLAFYGSAGHSPYYNALQGLAVAAVVFIFYGMTQLRDGPFIRPHPVFWRAVQAVSVIYLTSLVFLFFQNVKDARKLVAYLDPSLGVPLPERSYAGDCSLNWKAIYAQLDVFVAAHIFGWYGKTLILRDHWLCWIISVMFEVLEYSLQHQLPNFAECWWDHWILDVLLCNWLGIWLGMRTCKYLAMKTYNWRSIREIPDVRGKFRRTIEQFTPHSWISFDWAATKTFKGYCVVLLVTTFFLVCELNAFYLKYLLWIPPAHTINVFRIILHALTGAVALRETFQFFTDPRCKKIGTQAWLMGATVVIETLICVKFGRNEFPDPAPLAVVRFWKGLVALLIAFPIWQFWLRPRLFGTKIKAE